MFNIPENSCLSKFSECPRTPLDVLQGAHRKTLQTHSLQYSRHTGRESFYPQKLKKIQKAL